jgi:DNA-binding response OmpR family regulator
MQPVAVFPFPAPELAQTLDLGGYKWFAVDNQLDVLRSAPEDGWLGAVVSIDDNAESAWAVCRSLKKSDDTTPVLLLVRGHLLDELNLRDELFDDFCLDPFHPRELEARLRHMLTLPTHAVRPEIVEEGPLSLNVETYEAYIEERPLDLTYMEYELLRFLASSPGKVFTREVLLNRVWGYEYYGGARTVDVHVRRLRSKLGEENANLIQTVRSVGYKFGAARWN